MFKTVNKAYFTFNRTISSQKFVFLMGPPGIGKHLWALKLQKDLGFLYLSTTGAFRNILNHSSGKGLEKELIEKIRKVIMLGGVIPDELLIEMIRQKSVLPEAQKGLIIEGFPRNQHQLNSFLNVFSLDFVISLTMQDDILIERIARRRYCLKCLVKFNVSTVGGQEDKLGQLLSKEKNKCGECGGILAVREDDRERVGMAKIKEYKMKVAPLLKIFQERKVLQTVQINKEFDNEYKEVLDNVKKKLFL